jgi:hypothetical protein
MWALVKYLPVRSFILAVSIIGDITDAIQFKYKYCATTWREDISSLLLGKPLHSINSENFSWLVPSWDTTV